MHRVSWLAVAPLALAAAVASSPRIAQAATEQNFVVRTTGDLVDLCDPKGNTTMDVAAVNFCQGFVIGAITVQTIDDSASRDGDKLFCIPSPPPSRNEGIAAFVAWARAVPSRLGESAVDGLFRFVSERFPCSK